MWRERERTSPKEMASSANLLSERDDGDADCMSNSDSRSFVVLSKDQGASSQDRRRRSEA